MTTTTPDEARFYYRDFEGVEMGPFTLAKMRAWHRAGYFAPELPVRREGTDDFVPISDLAASGVFDQATKPRPKEEDTKAAATEQPEEFVVARPPQPQQQTEEKSGYLYKDARGEIFGPFSREKMCLWVAAGFLAADVPVALVAAAASTSEREFRPLSQHAELLAAMPQPQQAQQAAEPSEFTEYVATGKFNALSGRFQALTSQEYWGRRGLPTDGAGRQIARYMCLDDYQETRRRKAALLSAGLARPKAKKPPPAKKAKPLYSP